MEGIEIIRVTEEWQRAGVYYVRCEGMIKDFNVTLKQEFDTDSAAYTYILALDGRLPVSTCRLHYLDDETGKIERVCTIGTHRSRGIGAAVIAEAERWMKENGVKRVRISSRESALPFYEKLGYKPDFNNITGTGDFRCVMTKKTIG